MGSMLGLPDILVHTLKSHSRGWDKGVESLKIAWTLEPDLVSKVKECNNKYF